MTPQQIINDVALYYGITPRQLLHGDRHRVYAEPRQVTAYLFRTLLKLSFQTIAMLLEKKTHATIIYAVRKVNDWVNMPRLNPHAVNCINQIKS